MGPVMAPNTKAISPLIEMVFTIMFGVTMLIVIMNVVNPMFRRAQDNSIVTDAFQNLEMLNSAINSVASETQGSTRTVPLSVSGGTYRVNSTYDWLYFEYEPSERMQLSGQRSNVYVRQGLQFGDWFDSYADGSASSAGWTNMSGAWSFSNYKYSGTNGTTYHNVSDSLTNWKFSASISNVSGSTGGQVFVLPTNPESLVGFWPFDNASGSVAYDYSGNRNNGTLIYMNTTGNATSGWSTDCKYGGCLKFDGVNDYVSVNNVSLPGEFSVSFWVKRNNINTYDFVLGSPDNSRKIGFETGTNHLFVRVIRGGSSDRSVSVSSGSWQHVAVTRNSNNIVTAYVNGISNVLFSGTEQVGGYEFSYIGFDSSVAHDFNGTIDEVMIFNRSLSADEVKALYETSIKKISGGGGSQSIATKTPNPAIVLSNPAGQTKFDSVEVTDNSNKLTLLIPYSAADINGTLRVGKGEHQVEVRNMGVSATTGRPVIQLTAS